MSIQNEVVKFIAEIDLDAQDKAAFTKALKESNEECAAFRHEISETEKEIEKLAKAGKKKKRYAAIYNKEVYGHLKSGVWKFLMAALPKKMIRTMEDTIKGVDK